jgi:Fe-S-cluster-containing dehydrogenase component/DMSO reductase anchor subunit
MASSPDTAPGFIHNLETCVGCHACVIACANENGLEPERFWRHIVTHNPSRQPDLPVYHLSLACNHCLDAPCMEGCPAVAIVRHPKTGSVLIDDAKCIGCHYCSWVCPYDAPKFNAAEGVMTKCTLCNHRLLDGRQPACTSMCPTGALSFGQPATRQSVDVNGFPVFDVRPSIAFLPMTGRQPQPAPPGVERPAPELTKAWADLDETALPTSNTSLKNEWPLAVFTFIGIGLVAWILSAGFGRTAVLPEIILLAGLAGMGLSTMHLGRKERAWRAILNWRRSWLSREVIAFPVFLGVSAMWAAFKPESDVWRMVAVATGVFFVISVDGVYNAMAGAWHSKWDERSAAVSAAYLGALIGANLLIAFLFGAIRFAGFIDRMKLQVKHRRTGWEFLWIVGRIGMGFVLPLLLWGPNDAPSLMAVIAALTGELIDRLHFYASLDIVTPRRTMVETLRIKA